MDCTICATERSWRAALSARCEARGGGILPEIAAVAMRSSAVLGLADLRAEGHDSEAVFDAPVADPEVSGIHQGRCAREPRSDGTHCRFCNLLAFLRLHRMCRGGRDARALAAVAGSDPRIRHASYGTATLGMCTATQPSPGVAPGPAIPCGKAKRRAGTGASRPWSAMPDSPAARWSGNGSSSASKRLSTPFRDRRRVPAAPWPRRRYALVAPGVFVPLQR